ncbi:tetratricopeptide repeat protein [Flavihumibacter petaseus]|uniref:Uncharacterized protein n=1 Tax=Flavihumibacter petaseus NBRC 106054 TaxID=1220578 RepID=A0A0E9N6K0_9BACT|nr:tetratricopeptide repeat protein [Flavihumibacter petaseus]GAO45351.1 hypothetical protein FPE01S_05_00480 [Flavihumibacter petaseus NBRC 106054]
MKPFLKLSAFPKLPVILKSSQPLLFALLLSGGLSISLTTTYAQSKSKSSKSSTTAAPARSAAPAPEPEPTGKFADQLKEAAATASRGDNKAAYQQYRSIVADDPENLFALRGMAKTAESLQYAVIARETYKKIITILPNDTASISHLAVLFFDTHQYTEAADMGRRALGQNLGSGNEWRVAKSYYELKEYRSTLEYLDKLSKKDSSNAEAAFVMARCQIEMNNYKRAITAYEQAIRLDPNKPDWKFEVGMTYLAIPDIRNGVKWLENALANGYPRERDILETLAGGYIDLGAFDKAATTIAEILKSNPKDVNMLFMEGEANLRAGQYAAAIDSYGKLQTLDPKNARAIFMSGIAHIKMGDKSKGDNLCQQAIQMDPSLEKMRQSSTGLSL